MAAAVLRRIPRDQATKLSVSSACFPGEALPRLSTIVVSSKKTIQCGKQLRFLCKGVPNTTNSQEKVRYWRPTGGVKLGGMDGWMEGSTRQSLCTQGAIARQNEMAIECAYNAAGLVLRIGRYYLWTVPSFPGRTFLPWPDHACRSQEASRHDRPHDCQRRLDSPANKEKSSSVYTRSRVHLVQLPPISIQWKQHSCGMVRRHDTGD